MVGTGKSAWIAVDEPSAQLLAKYRDGGDERAAETLYARYVERLTHYARARLSPRLAGRFDPEDVVLSAYRSFFIGARDGRFSLKRSGDLWRLLVRMTQYKLYRKAAHHTAQLRSVDSERDLASDSDLSRWCLSREPTPDEAIALADELELVMANLTPLARRVLELRLQGETTTEIAAEVDYSERSVRRMLEFIRERLEQRYDEASNESPGTAR